MKLIAPEDIASEFSSQSDGTNSYVSKQGVINLAPTLGAVVRGFKGRCSHAVNQYKKTKGQSLWQRNYWEHKVN